MKAVCSSRHREVLVVSRVADQRDAAGEPGKVVGNPAGHNGARQPAGASLVELRGRDRPETQEGVQIQGRGAEVGECGDIDGLGSQGRRLERQIVIDELPKVRVRRRQIGVVTGRKLMPGRIDVVLHHLSEPHQPRLEGGVRDAVSLRLEVEKPPEAGQSRHMGAIRGRLETGMDRHGKTSCTIRRNTMPALPDRGDYRPWHQRPSGHRAAHRSPTVKGEGKRGDRTPAAIVTAELPRDRAPNHAPSPRPGDQAAGSGDQKVSRLPEGSLIVISVQPHSMSWQPGRAWR